MAYRRRGPDQARPGRQADPPACASVSQPDGLLHYGQGKWYPGESLPRWAFSLYWRADGVPLWKNADRIAPENANYRPTVEDVARLLTEAHRQKAWRLDNSYLVPAFEDFWHHVAQERALAINVSPQDSKLEEPETRARLARVFERGLTQAVGYVLPWWSERQAAPADLAQLEHWITRSGSLFLLPGDFTPWAFACR